MFEENIKTKGAFTIFSQKNYKSTVNLRTLKFHIMQEK